MKTIVEFDTEKEDENQKLTDLVNNYASKLRAAMWDFSMETLRKYRKYGVSLNDDLLNDLDSETLKTLTKNDSELKEKLEMFAELFVAKIEKDFYQVLESYEITLE